MSVEFEQDGPVATITLNRPERLNALTFEMYAELRDWFASIESRPHIKAARAYVAKLLRPWAQGKLRDAGFLANR